jgi:hypothetical protein
MLLEVTSPRQRLLLRSLEVQDLSNFRDREDGYIISQSVPDIAAYPVLRKLAAAGKRMLRYLNVLQMPRDEWVDPPGENAWMNWLASYPAAGPLTAPDGSIPRTPWFGMTKMWAWPRLGRLERAEVRAKLYELTCPPGWGLFLDHFWLEPRWWMFQDPDQYRLFDPVMWQAWRFNILAFLAEARLADDRFVLVNGENSAPPPSYFERADWTIEATWAEHLKLWRSHPDSVLSVWAGAAWAVQDAIEVWMQTGGWLAFTGDAVDVDRAYDAARRRRAPSTGQATG